MKGVESIGQGNPDKPGGTISEKLYQLITRQNPRGVSFYPRVEVQPQNLTRVEAIPGPQAGIDPFTFELPLTVPVPGLIEENYTAQAADINAQQSRRFNIFGRRTPRPFTEQLRQTLNEVYSDAQSNVYDLWVVSYTKPVTTTPTEKPIRIPGYLLKEYGKVQASIQRYTPRMVLPENADLIGDAYLVPPLVSRYLEATKQAYHGFYERRLAAGMKPEQIYEEFVNQVVPVLRAAYWAGITPQSNSEKQEGTPASDTGVQVKRKDLPNAGSEAFSVVQETTITPQHLQGRGAKAVAKIGTIFGNGDLQIKTGSTTTQKNYIYLEPELYETWNQEIAPNLPQGFISDKSEQLKDMFDRILGSDKGVLAAQTAIQAVSFMGQTIPCVNGLLSLGELITGSSLPFIDKMVSNFLRTNYRIFIEPELLHKPKSVELADMVASGVLAGIVASVMAIPGINLTAGVGAFFADRIFDVAVAFRFYQKTQATLLRRQEVKNMANLVTTAEMAADQRGVILRRKGYFQKLGEALRKFDKIASWITGVKMPKKTL